jgi:phage tail-like protein
MAAGPDALTWVLDRENRRLWGLDRYFRLLPLGDVELGLPDPGGFVPENGDLLPVDPPTASLSGGIALPAQDPIAVEALPDGGVLILDSVGIGTNSHLYHYPPGSTPGSLINASAHLSLPGLAEVTVGGVDHPMAAYDMALDADPSLLLLVEESGNQAIAYRLNFDESTGALSSVEPQAIFLPMHYFGGRSLARGWRPHGDEAIFYDVTPSPTQDAAVRWIRLHEIDQPIFARFAWIETDLFDSRQRGAVWHRLFVDGCIPPETSVEVWTRAGNDPDLLQSQPFVREPDLYLRGRGAEIPYWDGWQRSEQTPSQTAHTGVWEVLFQAARGQYLQIRLILVGNGRASPQIARLRVYYPRFSYVKNYLPAAYQEDPGSADFLERFLANIEGFTTDLEGKIANSSLLFDPSSAPAEALDWLATWLGLVLDPLWSNVWNEDRRRLLIRFAPRLYARRGTPEGLRFALLLLLDPCLEQTLSALEGATAIPNSALRQELESLGLPYPTLASGEAEIEELLWNYVLAAPGRTSVRIVEQWQTRQGMALQAGDPGGGSDANTSLKDALDRAKHQFSVLVPEDLSDEHRAMVEKIIRLEKPAHTRYDIRRFWDLFLVGQVRLGIDTILGEEGRFLPIILGRDYLSEGYLESTG